MTPADWSLGEDYSSPVCFAPPEWFSSMDDASNGLQPAAAATAAAPPNAKQPNGTTIQPLVSNMQPNPTQQQPRNQLKTSRKRSRDEMTEGLDDQDSDDSHSSIPPFPSARPTPSPPKQGAGSRVEPILGPGMTLIYPDDDASMARAQMDAASQTGTWAEELSERLRSSSMRESNQRPPLESRKSLRLDREAAAKMDDVASAAVASDPRVKLSFGSNNPSDEIGPTIDEASYTLGVAWSCIPSTSTMDAATRGWARHIEARFPLQAVRFVWVNKSLPAYLISAVTCDGRERSGSPSPQPGVDGKPVPWSNRVGSPGYYLFDESLSQGRLVAKSWERALENLRASPIIFEGEHVLQSAESSEQAQRASLIPPINPPPDAPIDDGMMTDAIVDQGNNNNHLNPAALGSTFEPKYWAGWGKPSVPALYPQRSLNSCSPFENRSQQQHMAPMIEVGGIPANMVGGEGMDLDY